MALMKYQGSKARIAKFIAPIILADRKENQAVVEPFCGGANFTAHINGVRIANDVNECLVACHIALSNGWIPPENISRDFYNDCRTKYNNKSYSVDEMKIIGYVGINGSYGGRYYDGGYAGITTTENGKVRNYPNEAFRNVTKNQHKIKGVTFYSGDYKDLVIPDDSIIYSDPWYRGSKQYKEALNSGFNPEEHWQWCREQHKKGHKVFVSEYEAPDDFKCVWEKELTSSLRANAVISGAKKSTEKLFTLK